MRRHSIGLLGSLAIPLVALVILVQLAAGNTAVPVVIDAIYYDSYGSGEPDEAVQIRNISQDVVNLAGWQLDDGSSSRAFLPAGLMIAPGQSLWLTRDATAFFTYFGHWPDAAVTVSQPGSAELLTGSWPGYANSGDEVVLRNASGTVMDCVVYGSSDGAACVGYWQGTAVKPYVVTSVFGSEGQILTRKRDEASGEPVPDTDTAADWAQDTADPVNGRKVRYPGWDTELYQRPVVVTETAVLTVAIAPDNSFATIVNHIHSAVNTIQIESLTFENIDIANALIAAAQRGVTVTALLEGEPTGGVPEQEKYICQQLTAAGGSCWFMYNDSASRVFDRYKYLHAKFILIDGNTAIVLSENLSYNSLPTDDKLDGTWGRRGVALITDAPGVVAHLAELFARDWDPVHHNDLVQWQVGHSEYGLPGPTFQPVTDSGGITYTVRFPQAATFQGTFAYEVVQAPDNSLRVSDGLIGLVNRAGEGDTVLVQQLSERPYWGVTASNASADPNLRLEAYLAAARRGATVRLLLDSFFDQFSEPTSNYATCTAVNAIARSERLDLVCSRANPTGLGIHNKMVLVQVDGLGYIHVGSINGTEQSSKGNRELALQVQSNEAYQLLATMFWGDWPHDIYLPLVQYNFIGPAGYVLISEVLYDSPGTDQAEFIELYNPTGVVVDLGGYSLGDAVLRTDFEDVRRFPPGTLMPPWGTLVVATSAAGFFNDYGDYPDFEILESVTAVPNLIDDLNWGDPATFLQLGNQGDEVLLRDTADNLVDAIVYGSGSYPGIEPCPLVTTFNASLQRDPYWRDTNNCTNDFREWPFPSPGIVP